MHCPSCWAELPEQGPCTKCGNSARVVEIKPVVSGSATAPQHSLSRRARAQQLAQQAEAVEDHPAPTGVPAGLGAQFIVPPRHSGETTVNPNLHYPPPSGPHPAYTASSVGNQSTLDADHPAYSQPVGIPTAPVYSAVGYTAGPGFPPPSNPPVSDPKPVGRYAASASTTPTRRSQPSIKINPVLGIVGLGVIVVVVVTSLVVAGVIPIFKPSSPSAMASAWLPTLAVPSDAPVLTYGASGDPNWVPTRLNPPHSSGVPLPKALTDRVSNPTVTQVQATTVLNAMWQQRQAAFAANDNRLFAILDAGAALEQDLGRCGCNPISSAGPNMGTQILIPSHAQWPSQFMGEVTTQIAGQPWVEMLVLQREKASASWKVVLATGYQPSGPLLDMPTTGVMPPAVLPGGVTPQDLPKLLATYWQNWKDIGFPLAPELFVSGPFTSQFGTRLAQTGQGDVHPDIDAIGHYRYMADPTPANVFIFPTADHELVCGVVRIQRVWTARPNNLLAQDQEQTKWAHTLAPGLYNTIVDDTITQPCFVVGNNIPVVVRSGEEYQTVALGRA